MLTGFIFDMDGTLMDTIRIWHEAEKSITDAAGIVLSEEDRDELNTLTLEEAGEFFHARFGIMGSGHEVVQTILDYMLAFYRTEAEPNPGAIDFVRAAWQAKCPMCVLSSSPQLFLQAGLAQAGLKDFFEDDLIISADDMGMTKRKVSTFDYVCRKLGTDPADTWLFDDSWYALQTANQAGLRCVGVFSTDGCGTHEQMARFSERVVDSFAELDFRDFVA